MYVAYLRNDMPTLTECVRLLNFVAKTLLNNALRGQSAARPTRNRWSNTVAFLVAGRMFPPDGDTDLYFGFSMTLLDYHA